jgi:hypothetical protein
MAIENLINLENLGTAGVIKDIPPWYLPPEAWSDAGDMRFYNAQALRMAGHTQVFGTPSIAPGFLMNVPAPNSSFWIYGDLADMYVYDAGVHTKITKNAFTYNAIAYAEWNACLLAGIPILTNPHDVPQYWSPQSVGQKLQDLTAWPSTLRARVVRNIGPYLVALNLVDTGIALPQTITWSNEADPGAVPTSWDYTDPTVSAGRTHLTDTKGGQLLDAGLLGSIMVLYKENATHSLRFIGGTNVFAPDLLFGFGILATRCWCQFDGGNRHFVVTPDDIIIHSGTVSSVERPFESRYKSAFFADLDVDHFSNTFCFENPAFKEVWLCYPQSGQTYPNKAIVWNYQNGSGNNVTIRDFNGTCADVGAYTDSAGRTWDSIVGTWDEQVAVWAASQRRRTIFGDPNGTKIYSADTGYAFGSDTVTAFIERVGLAILGKDQNGKPKVDYENRKLCTRIWPKIRGTASVSVRVGAQDSLDLDAPVTWCNPVIYDKSLGFCDVDPPVNGRALAVRMESTSDAPWQVEGYGLEVAGLGKM